CHGWIESGGCVERFCRFTIVQGVDQPQASIKQLLGLLALGDDRMVAIRAWDGDILGLPRALGQGNRRQDDEDESRTQRRILHPCSDDSRAPASFLLTHVCRKVVAIVYPSKGR